MAFVVDLNVATNVMVMDAGNWSTYKRGGRAAYLDGGYFNRTPAVVHAPRAGSWWVVVDAPAGTTVRYTITPQPA